jgi:uncharacterized protein with ATP-grasp and redox domains
MSNILSANDARANTIHVNDIAVINKIKQHFDVFTIAHNKGEIILDGTIFDGNDESQALLAEILGIAVDSDEFIDCIDGYAVLHV